MPSLPEEANLDNPLYGDFEDYLDGALPEARCREVEDLLARSASARALLDDLITARAWLRETKWDVPEPARWPSAEAILARAGRRPTPTSRRRSDWLARWSALFRSPAWALGAAACLALLAGAGLWRMLAPSPADEVAQSSRSQPPEEAAPAISAPAPAAPAASPIVKSPPAATPGKDKSEKPLLDAAPADRDAAPPAESPESALRPPSPSPMASPPGQAEPAPPPAPAAPAARVAGAAQEARSPAERAPESRDQASAPSAKPEAWKEAGKDGISESDEPVARKADAGRANESPGARARSSVAEAGTVAPVTLRLVVADRSRAAEQATAVARALGGAARLDGERLVVTVPAARVADCAARLRARVSTAAEGQPLQITVRAQE